MAERRRPGGGRKPDPAIAGRNDRIAQRYRDGAPLAECALDFALSISAIRKILAAAAMPMRPRGGVTLESRGDPAVAVPDPALAMARRDANHRHYAAWLAKPGNLAKRAATMAGYMRRRRQDPDMAEMERRARLEWRADRALRRMMAESAALEEKLDG